MTSDKISPEDWLADLGEPIVRKPDERLTHPDNPNFHEDVRHLVAQRRAEHYVVASLAELRRLFGLSQLEAAEAWGKTQPQVSRLERDPARAAIETLASYLRALGGHLAVEAEIGDHTYRYELA